MFTISNRNNFYNNDMSLLDDMFFDQAFLDHSMQPRYAFEPFRFCDARSASRRTALQMNCFPSVQSKRRHPMALTFDMLPFKRSRQNYFDDLMVNQMMPKGSQLPNSFNIENLSNINPKNLKIKIDKNSNSLNINYQKKSDNSFYQISETKSLPNFIKEHDLFEKIRCNFENGQVQISFPENPVSEQTMIEGEKSNEKEIEGEIEDKAEPEIVSIDLVSEEEEKEEEEKRKSSAEEEEAKNEKIVMPGLE